MAEPKRLSDLLGGILRQVRHVSAHNEVAAALAETLGHELGSHCRVGRLAKGRLTVEVDSAPLFAELAGFQKEAIRSTLNQKLTGLKIAEIAFSLRGSKQ